MTASLRKLITLLILSIPLSGCVGAVALYTESITYNAPFVTDASYSDSAGKLRSTKTSTQEAFLREWGGEDRPAKQFARAMSTGRITKEKNGAGSDRSYPTGFSCMFRGRSRCFLGNAATSITVLRTTERGVMCGLFVNGIHGGHDLCTK